LEKFGIEKKGIDDIERRRKFGNGFARADVTDVTDVRKKEEGSL
jgi:hypothetical protein